MSESTPRADGRTARTDRTRESLVEAHLSLITQGDLKPTGERIAQRAGISLRTLWVSFKDLEALFDASGEAVLAQERNAFRVIDPDLALPSRIEAFCAQRAVLLELIAPHARAAKLREPFSQALRRNRSRHLQLVRDDISRTFVHELAMMTTPSRVATEDGLLTATTWAAWSFLRDDLDRPRAQARAVMKRCVTALLVQP